jgi:Putative transposase, YhgA-like
MQPHDSAYKNIYAQPELIRDLLLGFVPQHLVQLLDMSDLSHFEKISCAYITDDLRPRDGDMVWRVRMKPTVGLAVELPSWAYVYVLSEFQSKNDPAMAVRILTYTGLLYQDLIKGGHCKADDLPCVFPIVIYNGQAPWTAKHELKQLRPHTPKSLERYQSQAYYFVLDQGRLDASELGSDNAVAGMARIEFSPTPRVFERQASEQLQLLERYGNLELKRAFLVWLKRCVLQRFRQEPDFDRINGGTCKTQATKPLKFIVPTKLS